MSVPSILPQMLVVTLLAAVSAAGLGACGGEPPAEQVRLLRLNPVALTSTRAPSATTVRASLIASPRPPLAPAMSVPQVGSIAAGATNGGRLVKGLQLPATGPDWVTYDPIRHTIPNRAERRWATDRLLAFLLYVLRDYRLANRGAPPLVIGDLSRPHGGPFGRESADSATRRIRTASTSTSTTRAWTAACARRAPSSRSIAPWRRTS